MHLLDVIDKIKGIVKLHFIQKSIESLIKIHMRLFWQSWLIINREKETLSTHFSGTCDTAMDLSDVCCRTYTFYSHKLNFKTLMFFYFWHYWCVPHLYMFLYLSHVSIVVYTWKSKFVHLTEIHANLETLFARNKIFKERQFL